MLANLTSAESYIDAFSGKMDETSVSWLYRTSFFFLSPIFCPKSLIVCYNVLQPEEELEIELEIIRNEDISQPPFNNSPGSCRYSSTVIFFFLITGLVVLL